MHFSFPGFFLSFFSLVDPGCAPPGVVALKRDFAGADMRHYTAAGSERAARFLVDAAHSAIPLFCWRKRECLNCKMHIGGIASG